MGANGRRMTYLNKELMERTNDEAFRHREPFPWLNPRSFITDEGFAELLGNMPESELFDQSFGVRRQHGQMSHDRLTLDYREDLPIAECWHAFVRELEGDDYQRFVRRMFGRGFFRLVMHWHYTPNGCSVSPHCDSTRKLGSHIFYFNDETTWQPEWGGETVILDDGGRLPTKSAPKFEDFDREIAAEAMGNRSLLFARRGTSWHGVRPIQCPPGALRKVFIVVMEDWALGLGHRIVQRARGKRVAA